MEPDTKFCELVGWNCTLVTKSVCQKERRHSLVLRCHRRTLLSTDALSRKWAWRGTGAPGC
jgi:hypothetical protein